MHSEETNIHTVQLLKCKYRFGLVRELLREIGEHLSYPRLGVQHLLGGGNHSNCYLTSTCCHLSEEVVDSVLHMRADLTGRELCRQEKVR